MVTTFGGICSSAPVCFCHIFLTCILFYPQIFAFLSSHVILNFSSNLKDMYGTYSKPKSTILLVEMDNKIIGMVGITSADTSKKGVHKGYRKDYDAELHRINILPKYQGLKISKVMIAKAFEFAKQNGYKRVVLTSSSFQYIACTYVYSKLGFSNLHDVQDGMIRFVFYAKDIV